MTASSSGYRNGTIYSDIPIGTFTGGGGDPPSPIVPATCPDLARLRERVGDLWETQWLWHSGVVLHLRGATFHQTVFLCPTAQRAGPGSVQKDQTEAMLLRGEYD